VTGLYWGRFVLAVAVVAAGVLLAWWSASEDF
jgi:hypothetical protein